MAMINLKLTAQEQKQDALDEAQDTPAYPYGLQLHLDDDTMKKLGIDAMPQVGASIQFTANANVCGARARAEGDGGTEASMDLQITDMQIHTPPASFEAKARKIYDPDG